MSPHMNRTWWLVALLSVLIGCRGGSSPGGAASTPAGAVEALIQAVKPIEANDREPTAADLVAFLQAIAPHLADSSRETVECFLAAVPEARDHDRMAQKTFGESLAKAEGYHPSENGLAMAMSFSTLLARIPPGAKAEIVKQAEKSATEVMFRLRWRKGDPQKTSSELIEETVVAVRDGAGWKVLIPLSGTISVGTRYPESREEEYSIRKQEDWDAAAVRQSNQKAMELLRAIRTKTARVTEGLKTGKYPSVDAYLAAANAEMEAP